MRIDVKSGNVKEKGSPETLLTVVRLRYEIY